MSKKIRKVSKNKFNINKIMLITFTIVFIASVLFTPTFKNLTGRSSATDTLNNAQEAYETTCYYADTKNKEQYEDAKKYANRVEKATIISTAQDIAKKINRPARKAEDYAKDAQSWATQTFRYADAIRPTANQLAIAAQSCADDADRRAKKGKKISSSSKSKSTNVNSYISRNTRRYNRNNACS